MKKIIFNEIQHKKKKRAPENFSGNPITLHFFILLCYGWWLVFRGFLPARQEQIFWHSFQNTTTTKKKNKKLPVVTIREGDKKKCLKNMNCAMNVLLMLSKVINLESVWCSMMLEKKMMMLLIDHHKPRCGCYCRLMISVLAPGPTEVVKCDLEDYVSGGGLGFLEFKYFEKHFDSFQQSGLPNFPRFWIFYVLFFVVFSSLKS